MKKYLTPALAVIAVIAIVLCIVFAGQRGVKQEDYDALNAKLTDAEAAAKTAAEAAAKEKEEAVAAVQATADDAVAAKTELEGQVADLTTKLTDAEAAAKTAAEAAAKEKDEAVAAIQATADEAVKAKTELEGQVADLTSKLTDAEAAAKAAAEAAVKEKEEAVAAAQVAAETDTKTKIDEAVKAVQDKADAAKTAFEGQIADLNKQLEEAKEAATKDADAAAKALADAADAAKAELEGKVTELTDKLAAAETAKDEAVAAAKKELETAKTELETAKEEAVAAAKKEAEEAKATLEAKVAELEQKIADAAKGEEKPEEKPAEPAAEDAVMDHAAYVEAEQDSAVCVETYVQATQSWWDNKITVYAQSKDGAYFIYNMACTEEDAAKLVPGAKIRVKGFKSEWSGEVEITDATFELLEGDTFVAEPEDITAALGTEDLINHQNEKVLFKGLTVAAQDDGAAFGRKNPTDPDDLYVRFTTADGQVFNFCVEYYLTNENSDVYKAVEGLQIGDVVDVEGYLYWYEGPNTHITAVTKAQ